MNDAKALYKAIELHPLERTPKLALADLYEERGLLHVALAIRWCVARDKWPWTHDSVSGVRPTRYRRFSWTCPHRYRSARRQDVLPECVYRALPNAGRGRWTHTWPDTTFFFSVELALSDLGYALDALRSALEVPA